MGQDTGTPTRVRATAHAEIGPRLTSVRGSAEPFFGGGLVIEGAGPVDIGLSGAVLMGKNEIPGAATGSDLELGMGYAGILVRRWASLPGVGDVGVAVLAGAGNATVALAAVDTEIAADNFGVIEPEALIRLEWNSAFDLIGRISYRWVYGVEDLPEIGPDQLQGPSLGVSISFGPF